LSKNPMFLFFNFILTSSAQSVIVDHFEFIICRGCCDFMGTRTLFG
jgi:hypothetical protein